MELLKVVDRFAFCYTGAATQVPSLRLAKSPYTVRFARLSRDLCRSETQRKGGLFCGR